MRAVLIDCSLSWGNTQENLLALVQSLVQEGRFRPQLCCPRGSPLARKAAALGLPVTLLPASGRWNVGTLLRLWWLLHKELHCIVHTFGNAARLGNLILGLRPQGRTVLIHQCKNIVTLDCLNSQGQILSWWRAAHKVICGNKYMADQLIQAGMEPAKVACIPAGIDLEALPPRKSLPEKRCIFVGTAPHGDTAGYSVLIKAMAALWQNEDLPDWEVRLMGRDLDFQALLDEALSLGIESRLAILGDQPMAEVLPLCHVLVAAGTRPTGALHAIAAAWATGLPLLCPELPVNREWVQANSSALIYKPEDPQELAAHMKKLMRDPALYQRLVAEGLHCAPKLSLPRATAACRHLYGDCLDKKGWVLPQAPKVPVQAAPPPPV